MQPLWTTEQVIEATNGTLLGTDQQPITSVSIDSRTLKHGALFIALRGENFDGHDYVQKALQQGAVAAIVDQDFAAKNQPESGCWVVVNDTEKALVDMGTYRRKQSKAKFVGVTGSVGKTSVKEMLKLALSVHGNTYATEGNLNNHLGTPLTLARIHLSIDYAVIEMGMNHANEIAYLTQMVQPDVSIITTIEAVHLEAFESMEGIADAKAEIFLGQNSDHSVAVLNKDNAYFDYLLQKSKIASIQEIIAFGQDDQAEFCLTHYDESTKNIRINNALNHEEYRYQLPIEGLHQAKNSCGVLAVIDALGLPVQPSADALSNYQAPKGRGKKVTIQTKDFSFYLIDDAYNAGPASVKAAIETVKPSNNGRVIAVLADMLELGKTADELHASLHIPIQHSKVDSVYTIGTHMNYLHEALPQAKRNTHFETVHNAIEPILQQLQPNDTVLVKGSNGMKLSLLVDSLLQLPTRTLSNTG